jgi:hypothetical protein
MPAVAKAIQDELANRGDAEERDAIPELLETMW